MPMAFLRPAKSVNFDRHSLFGGVKGSGIDRELGPQGSRSFARVQSVYLD
jgi:hypothetical protein